MIQPAETYQRLAALPGVTASRDEPMSRHTRFGIGGPADILVEAASAEAFTEALAIARTSGLPLVVVGDGTNLIVSDAGFRGVVLRLRCADISATGTRVTVESGARLQSLVDFTVAHGLKGLETMTGIPGSVGAAIYGNAGAYGHSIMERIGKVWFHDGGALRAFSNGECEFRYRESIFKRHKDWIVLRAELQMETGDAAALSEASAKILEIRNRKYPPTMKCAGSIFKNLLLSELPEHVARMLPPNVIIEGKVPSAWFLEQVDAKGMRLGDIQVATYHANLIYNDGAGTAGELVEVIATLKARVLEKFGIGIEEEVQYVGFPG